jgi:hypothetical protein
MFSFLSLFRILYFKSSKKCWKVQKIRFSIKCSQVIEICTQNFLLSPNPLKKFQSVSSQNVWRWEINRSGQLHFLFSFWFIFIGISFLLLFSGRICTENKILHLFPQRNVLGKILFPLFTILWGSLKIDVPKILKKENYLLITNPKSNFDKSA